MKARAVIGANFGDEGKGLVVDYLCNKGAGVVVRFNSGAQAGHTVVTKDGRHVFKHFGSGSFLGVPTFLSQFFICNPIAYFREKAELLNLGLNPTLYAHPDCLVTTYADMIINQEKETKRGSKRHGSCGMGAHETITRSSVLELKVTMADLWNGVDLTSRMEQICDKYASFRIGRKIDEPAMFIKFMEACKLFAENVHPAGIGQCKDPVFEGAQGLLLDMDNKTFFPHVTHSKTGLHNVKVLCAQAGITDIEPFYVSRTYLTRHGAGPLPGENPSMKFEDNTNAENPWQEKLRFAPLDVVELEKRIAADAGIIIPKLVLTHCDQLDLKKVATLRAYGPTRNHIETERL